MSRFTQGASRRTNSRLPAETQIRQAHTTTEVLSGYYLADEVAAHYRSLSRIVSTETWFELSDLTVPGASKSPAKFDRRPSPDTLADRNIHHQNAPAGNTDTNTQLKDSSTKQNNSLVASNRCTHVPALSLKTNSECALFISQNLQTPFHNVTKRLCSLFVQSDSSNSQPADEPRSRVFGVDGSCFAQP